MVYARVTAISILIAAVIYQWWLKDFLFETLGIGRVLQPIESFPFKCHNLEHKQLEGCGDLWLDEDNRVLYAACTGIDARRQWDQRFAFVPTSLPIVSLLIVSSLLRFNVSGRRPGGSDLMALYIDQPRKGGLFKMHSIQPTKYGSAPGDGRLDLAGFDVQAVDSYTLRFWLLNQRPLYDSKGKIDTINVGINTTVDVYEHRRGDKKMAFVANSWSPTLYSANKIAWMGSNNFVVVNDRSAGLRRKLDPIVGGGNLVYYDDWLDRYTATPKKFPIPGMILRGMDDRIYVPSVIDGKIRVFQNQEDRSFKQVYSIKIGMPVTSLTLDANGHLWAVGRSKYDKEGINSRNAIFKIEQFDNRQLRYTVTKILEDKEGTTVKGASVAVYDAKTKRIFLSGKSAIQNDSTLLLNFIGAFSPVITLCEKKS